VQDRAREKVNRMKSRIAIVSGIVFLIASVPLLAQNTDLEALAGLKFNFGNPGARSLGMGGAFIGLADDASAAEANPAGLTILRKREISIEMRNTATSQSFPVGGVYPFVNEKDFPSRRSAIGFASAVLPFHNAAIAVYYHRPLQFQNNVNVGGRYSTPVFYLGPNGPVSAAECAHTTGCLQQQVYPYTANANVLLNTYGGAAAWAWRNVSFGAAVRYQVFREQATTTRTDIDLAGSPVFVVSQTHGNQMFGKSANNDLTWIGGIKWTPSTKVSVGGVYKKGASFPAPVFAGPVTAGSIAVPAMVAVTEFHVPDSAGAGISYRPLSNLTVNADAVRVRYSSLTDHFVSVIEYGTDGAASVEGLKGYESHDGTELHAGVEYFILSKMPFAIRGGWWRDPPHTIHYGAPLVVPHDVAAAILFPDRRGKNHYSVGVGIALPAFQIDVAYDTSETLKQATVSVVARY
jgi:long-subunit fatty acid transport protein